jgi:hypothetical protein
MKTCCGLMLVAAALVLGGCGNKNNPPPPSTTSATPAPTPASAPAGYVAGLARGQQVAVKTVDVVSLNQEIQLFNVQEGRNPKDLNELVTQHYLGALPNPPAGMKLVYDAAQGKVSVVPQ